jgi:hypothetical protein
MIGLAIQYCPHSGFGFFTPNTKNKMIAKPITAPKMAL